MYSPSGENPASKAMAGLRDAGNAYRSPRGRRSERTRGILISLNFPDEDDDREDEAGVVAPTD